MKQTCSFTHCLSVGILFVATLAQPVYSQTPTQTPTQTSTPTASPKKVKVQPSPFPKDVTAVFATSCLTCHGAEGRAMTLSVLNLSKWGEYDAGTKAKKAAAICEMVTKGAMPPASYQRSNPSSVLTTAQKKVLCKWSQTMSQKQSKTK